MLYTTPNGVRARIPDMLGGESDLPVITLASLVPTVAGANDFVTESALATVRVSLADAELDPAFAVVSAPARIVLV